MDARVDALDENNHANLLDLLRRSEFSEALNLFTGLLKLAHSQGQMDGLIAVQLRLSEASASNPAADIEDEIRRIRQ